MCSSRHLEMDRRGLSGGGSGNDVKVVSSMRSNLDGVYRNDRLWDRLVVFILPGA